MTEDEHADHDRKELAQLDARRYGSATRVRAEVFKPSGKWAYTAWLNYTDAHEVASPTGYVDPVKAAERALWTATTHLTSGVTFTALFPGWIMVVRDPPDGWPVMVTGRADG